MTVRQGGDQLPSIDLRGFAAGKKGRKERERIRTSLFLSREDKDRPRERDLGVFYNEIRAKWQRKPTCALRGFLGRPID